MPGLDECVLRRPFGAALLYGVLGVTPTVDDVQSATHGEPIRDLEFPLAD